MRYGIRRQGGIVRIAVLATATLLISGAEIRAQSIARTPNQAQAEGAAFVSVNAMSVQPAFVARPYGGTKDRRCVDEFAADTVAGEALRSGDFIIRGGHSLRAGRADKILWIPLHPEPSASTPPASTPLVVRAARVASASDTLRETIPGLAHSHAEYGYPSTLTLPRGGEWVVVATAGPNWGCFLLHVAEH
jgi:hypothetical protein